MPTKRSPRKRSPKIPPIKLRAQRFALARMYVDLTLAFHSTVGAAEDAETDADLVLVAVAVMMGHAASQPMNASEIAARIRVPRTSALRRLEILIAQGLVRRIGSRFYLEPDRSRRVPLKTKFEFVLRQGFAVLTPYLSKIDSPHLSKMDRPAKGRK